MRERTSISAYRVRLTYFAGGWWHAYASRSDRSGMYHTARGEGPFKADAVASARRNLRRQLRRESRQRPVYPGV
jgi:hypothetical protein